MKLKVPALVSVLLASVGFSTVASAQTAPTDVATITAAAVAQITSVSGISAQFALPLFGLAVVGVGIAIGMKYIKKGKAAA